MFVSDFVTIDLPVQEVQRRLVVEGSTRLSAHALAADVEAADLGRTHRPEPERADHRGTRTSTSVEIGDLRTRGDRTVIALRCTASGGSGSVFTDLDADLELAPVGPYATQVSLLGRYRPPPDASAVGTDQLLAQRVAQASIRAFLRRLKVALLTVPDVPLVTAAATH